MRAPTVREASQEMRAATRMGTIRAARIALPVMGEPETLSIPGSVAGMNQPASAAIRMTTVDTTENNAAVVDTRNKRVRSRITYTSSSPGATSL
jgi:hypothetical protein